MAGVRPTLAPWHRVYLDAERTHELHAQVALSGSEGLLVTTEFPTGSREPTETVQSQTRVRGEEELLTLVRELEDRLAVNGRYFRTDVNDIKWMPLESPSRAVDLRAHEAPIPGMEATGGRMRFHHFHAEGGGEGEDRLLISMPRPGMSGRHVLAEMRFTFPAVEEGALQVLHARLAPPVLASAVAKEHVEAPRKGLFKLFEPRDYERTFGEGWRERTKGMLGRAAARLVAGPTPMSVAPKFDEPSRLDMMKSALASPRVEALRAMYVDPVTEAQLVEGGEHAIRRYVNKLRTKASHRQAYDLSLLEATLLLEYAIPSQMWDLANEEGAKLMRFIYGYDA